MYDIVFNVAGTSFRAAENPAFRTFRPSGEVRFEPEPGNKYDKNAVKVLCGEVWLGYVPGPRSKFPEAQSAVLSALAAGKPYKAEVVEYSYRDGDEFNNEHRGELSAITIGLSMADGSAVGRMVTSVEEVVRPTSDSVVLHSFNEPDVDVTFFPLEHQYWLGERRLKSVTQLVSKMYAPFDAELIAPRCEKKYGMPADEIIAMWKLNGEMASSFGTAVHAAIEAFEKYGERGLPKMPVLRQIVEAFPFTPGLKVHSEVLITSSGRGLCGLCDRLVDKDGRLTVCDLKCQPDIDEVKSSNANLLYPDLPKNKVTKAVVQESLYSEMLAESGLNVNDVVVVYAFDGSWRTFTEPRIRGILDKACSL